MPIDVFVIVNSKNGIKDVNYFQEVESKFPKTDEWEDVTHLLTSESYKTKLSDIEVFLCFREDLIISDFDNNEFIEKVFESAVHSVWGAKIYVIVDRTIENADLKKLERFFELSLEYQICDIFEVGTENAIYLRDNWEINIRQIIKSISEIKAKRLLLKNDISKSGWDCIVPKGIILSDEKFIPFGSREINDINDSKLLIYCSEDKKYAKRLINKTLEFHQNRSLAIANIGNCLSQEEKKAFQREGLKSIDFAGNVDLFYYLRKINQKRESLHLRETEVVKITGLQKTPLFNAFDILPTSRILITNAFPKNQDLCREAALEVGSLQRLLAVETEIEVHSGIEFKDLPNNLERPLTVWMFQGHGNDDCLEDFFENSHTPEELLKRFKGYNNDFGLALVFFASCQSALFAKIFASHGVGVAIGFDSKIRTSQTKLLAEKIIPVAAKIKDRKVFVDEVLRTFQKAVNTVDSKTLEIIKPVAFYSER